MRQEWKSAAKASMKLAEPSYLLLGLYMLIIALLAGMLSDGLGRLLGNGGYSALGGLCSWLIASAGGVLCTGIIWYFLDLSRNSGKDFRSVFSECTSRFGNVFLTVLLSSLFISLWSILLIFPGIIAACSYSQALFLLRDNPGMGPMEAIRQSRQMMKGHKWEYFVLQLSFILWWLLFIVTAGIIGIYVLPYISSTEAVYYDYLRGLNSADSGNTDIVNI